ncbi:penicillin-binding protein 2 [Jeotgalibacillus sp. S-D1]|uniref:peptidoglycan D,D-transpeptidase FtsI family protein n=1 Tax=Jeotgalibacillus sp. S-D1 TaxID=2552189 RepID=UPI001F0CFBB5|nr:penicillin-binding protein 2 [Jeotgalibacillus sp. S-D1]
MKKDATRSKEKKAKKTHVSSRMNVLFFAVFLLFSLLILRLGVLQIVNGENYVRELERTEEVVVNTSVPRGKIFDRYGNIVVDNQPVNAITYTKTQQTKQEEMLMVAERLAGFIEVDTKKVTDRDKQDFWIRENESAAEEKLTADEKAQFEAGDMEQAQYDKLIRDRITDEELKSITGQDLEELAIYIEMQAGYNLSPQIIKNEKVTDEEFAVVSEHLDSLPGVNTTVDWNRQYAYGDVFRSALGSVRSIPEDKIEYYLSRDYSRNDRVGTSYLELQYEDILQGQKSKVKTLTDKAGNVVDSQLVHEGERGKDLVLSVDMELQKEVEKIVEDELWRLKQSGGRNLLDRAFVVMMDPHTGEVLSMVGKQYVEEDNGKSITPVIQDYNIGTFTSAYEAGSSVKGATVLSAYQEGIITPGSTLYDEVIRIKGSPPKKSYFNYGSAIPLTDTKALEKSSNGYMFKIAIAMANAKYTPDQPIDIPQSAFTKMRNYFGQFGLGSETGIDLPGENTGYQANNDYGPGKLLDLSIGQFDTYTTMQMAQYVSTIANGGNRIAPKIVKQIREPSKSNDTLGPLLQEMQPEILNKLDNTEAEIAQVQRGFFGSFNGAEGTGRDFIGNGYVAAGKTGTAEVVYFGPKYQDQYLGNPPETINSTLVGYAPAEDPEVAFAVLVPWVYPNGDESLRVDVNENLGTAVLEKYFELREKRIDENGADEDVEVNVSEEGAEEGN